MALRGTTSERTVFVCTANLPPIFWSVLTLHNRCTLHSFIILLCDRATKDFCGQSRFYCYRLPRADVV
jgi:hypothetical protein